MQSFIGFPALKAMRQSSAQRIVRRQLGSPPQLLRVSPELAIRHGGYNTVV
jgi:hypothetical protein